MQRYMWPILILEGGLAASRNLKDSRIEGWLVWVLESSVLIWPPRPLDFDHF